MQISELRKRHADQRKEYEEILAEQRDFEENEASMKSGDLHAKRYMTVDSDNFREETSAASEAHTVDVEKMQHELDRAREQIITGEEACSRHCSRREKESALANAASENTVVDLNYQQQILKKRLWSSVCQRLSNT